MCRNKASAVVLAAEQREDKEEIKLKIPRADSGLTKYHGDNSASYAGNINFIITFFLINARDNAATIFKVSPLTVLNNFYFTFCRL